MIYGMYLSATGVVTSAYRQDLIANNLANSDTIGFKRDLASFSQRPPADQENPLDIGLSNEMLDKIGGGAFSRPTLTDTSQGTIDPTGNNLDAALVGSGYFTVTGKDGNQRLTRDGRFRIDRGGNLTLGTDQANPVLDSEGKPIVVDPTLSGSTTINSAGQVLQNGKPVATLGIVDVADPAALKKEGGSLMSYPPDAGFTDYHGQVQGGFLEHSNVDPATEMAELMDTQRQLEANANMIRYQDTTLGELVNTVGKVS